MTDTTTTVDAALLVLLVAALRATSDVDLNAGFATLAESTGIPGADTYTIGVAWDSIADELAPRAAAGWPAYEVALDAWIANRRNPRAGLRRQSW